MRAHEAVQREVPEWLPPPALRPLHFPALVRSLWLRLQAALADPVRTELLNGRAVVHVLGVARVYRERDGSFSVQLCKPARDGHQWTHVGGDEVVLEGMPAAFHWLVLFRDLAADEVRREARQAGLDVEDSELRSYMADLFRHFRRQVRRRAALRQVRRSVAQHLRLDPDVMRLARRLVTGREGVGGIRVDEYNAVAWHQPALLVLEREMPQLLPLYAAIADRPDFQPRDEPAQALRLFLLQHGLGPRVWRLICRSSRRLLLPVATFYVGPAGDAMLDYLQVLATLGFRREPPRTLIEALLYRYGRPEAPLTTYLPYLRNRLDMAPAFCHAAQVFATLEPGEQRRQQQTLELVLEWLDGRRVMPDKLQRRAGWDWLVAGALAWREQWLAEMGLDGKHYPVPFSREIVGEYELCAVSSALDLWHEGHAMRHCIVNHRQACAAGDAVVISLRARRTGRRVATALLWHYPEGWHCREVRGFANCTPDASALAAVETLVERLNRAATEVLWAYDPASGGPFPPGACFADVEGMPMYSLGGGWVDRNGRCWSPAYVHDLGRYIDEREYRQLLAAGAEV